jgi:hypothetical protein
MLNVECKTCKSWHPVAVAPKLRSVDDLAVDPLPGQCRINPPVIQIIPVGQDLQGQMKMAIQGMFSPCDSDNWCSKHSDLSRTLAWNNQTGFERAPTLEEARHFAPVIDGEPAPE